MRLSYTCYVSLDARRTSGRTLNRQTCTTLTSDKGISQPALFMDHD